MTTATPFIQNLVNEFTRSGSRDFSEQLLIFPNRRAGIFFKQALSQTLDGPVWAPSIQSIQDFVADNPQQGQPAHGALPGLSRTGS
jgi:hypothetical protein